MRQSCQIPAAMEPGKSRVSQPFRYACPAAARISPKILAFLPVVLAWAAISGSLAAEPLAREEIDRFVKPPLALGDSLGNGVWELAAPGGSPAGYALETEPLAPLPGFSGAPINVFVALDLEGRIIDAALISHNEPIFVSGLGEKPFRDFFAQYRGMSLSDTIVVGTPYGEVSEGSSLRYLDGVTKATASVRIAHESLLGAALAVAREKMRGIAAGPPARPLPGTGSALDWETLIADGHVSRLKVSNSEVQAAFEGTKWADDDPDALEFSDAPYIDLWLADIGPGSVARGILAPETLAELEAFMAVSEFDEPILVVETARHGLVSPEFVRNTSPDWLAASQDGLPVALRDADIFVTLSDSVPKALHEGVAMVLRADRRLGFDPTRDWELSLTVLRRHGAMLPEIGTRQFSLGHVAPEAFFARPEPRAPKPAWLELAGDRAVDIAVTGAFLAILLPLLLLRQNWLAGLSLYRPIRLGILAFVLVYAGWWAQAQLSVVTVLGVLRAATDGASLQFLVYDPVSLLVWAAAILGFAIWGRGLFCGWLCPFGALQEFAHHAGRALRLPQWRFSERLDRRLQLGKYAVLAGLAAITLFAPSAAETASEIEPFKTAITTYFVRDWPYVAYAAILVAASAVLFKGFCRYICPLGAFMAIGGVLRARDWIDRRQECGSPCQLCRVKCEYGAIGKSGAIRYSECFQCLDCVSIHDDPARCVPLIVGARREARQ